MAVLYERICPICFETITHHDKKGFEKSVSENRPCRSCAGKNRSKEKKWFRRCPKCGNRVGYTDEKNRDHAKRDRRVCNDCLGKFRMDKYKGKGNPFYGKSHTESAKRKIAGSDRSYTQTEEFREKSRRLGKLNGMFGKSMRSVLIDKYGSEEGGRRWDELKAKRSLQMAGEGNNMFGKPSPVGSGGGWGGWYKGFYFRSLRELNYILTVLEPSGEEWISAEKIPISYTGSRGQSRTYLADFLVGWERLVEIKPGKLQGTSVNNLKRKAAEEYCEFQGWKFEVVDIEPVRYVDLLVLCDEKKVVLNKKYRSKLEEIRCKLAKNANCP